MQRTATMLLLLVLLVPYTGRSQTSGGTTATILVSIPDPNIITTVSFIGAPSFSVPGVNAVISSHNVTGFKKAYPDSRFGFMRDIYQMNCNNSNLGATLKANWPQYFPHYEVPKAQEILAEYYPSDWQWGNDGYLKYINAHKAWGINQGDPNVIIGISDTYFDLRNPDLQGGKIARLANNVTPPNSQSWDEEWAHGTMVAGYAAGRTDNDNQSYPAIGFKCRLDLDGRLTNDAIPLQMARRDVPIFNGSWGGYEGVGSTLENIIITSISRQQTYQDIYERGTFSVFGAGNGQNKQPGQAGQYMSPACLDHVFAVTSIGWLDPYGAPGSDTNVAGIHEKILGDTLNLHQHNDRVDIMAPGYGMGGLFVNRLDTNEHFTSWAGTGTSFAAPIVAGTAGLLLSTNPCLSPYQLEWILKASAYATVLSFPDNLKYAGRLGAGLLDAEKAVVTANNTTGENLPSVCNNLLTQTMVIDGVDFNTTCAPGFSTNGVIPKLTPVIRNGTPPYTARWRALPGNNTSLNDITALEPEVTSSSGDRLVFYRLTVYDSDPVAQKVADKLVRIQLKTTLKHELVVRDAYEDMGDEPNGALSVDSFQWNIWKSPDVWVRRNADGQTEHQDPEYHSTDSNHIYVRVRNLGCAPMDSASNLASLNIYWTVASTGENWDSDWNGSTYLAGSGGVPVRAGGVIVNDIPLPHVMHPGTSAIIHKSWQPQRPQEYENSPTKVDACLLARIQEYQKVRWGGWAVVPLAEYLDTNVKVNVLLNNNIATRNLLITDLEAGRSIRRQVWVSNTEAHGAVFTLELINDKEIRKHLAGDITAFTSITLHLGRVFDRWVESGGQGHYASVDEINKTVTFDGSLIRLEGIRLEPGEHLPVQVEFDTRADADLQGNVFDLFLRQFLEDENGNASTDVYGNVCLQVNAGDPKPAMERKHKSFTATSAVESSLVAYPNPAGNELFILSSKEVNNAQLVMMDITGRNLYTASTQIIAGQPHRIPLADLAPGVYFIRLFNKSGYDERVRFIKK